MMVIKNKIKKEAASKAIDFVLEKTKYLELFDSSSEEGMMRIGNVKEFLNLSKRCQAIWFVLLP